MIVVTVQPNGSNIKIQNYIVKNEYFNRNMTQFYDAFPQIQEGDFNMLGWVGCVGAARLKEDENGYLKVAWFIDYRRAGKATAAGNGYLATRSARRGVDRDKRRV